MKFRSNISLFIVLLISIMTTTSALAVTTSIYAVSTDNDNIYEINLTTGAVAHVTTGQFESVSLACDGTSAYYWNTVDNSCRGLAKWTPATNSHTLISSFDISEKNACVDSKGDLWVLDRTNTVVDGVCIWDDTRKLYKVDKNTGTRIDTYTLPDVGGYAVGDIAWGPDGKLYISTNNVKRAYDTYNNYVWDPLAKAGIDKIAGEYHAGLVWVNGKLYGSKTVNGTGTVFELDPTDFSEVSQVATMPTAITIGDLSTAVPEPATICLLGLASVVLLKKHRK